jgi:hypothetical protein
MTRITSSAPRCARSGRGRSPDTRRCGQPRERPRRRAPIGLGAQRPPSQVWWSSGASMPRDNRFGSPLKLLKVHWVRPEVVVEVTYLTWTEGGLLRAVSYQGQLEDKPARRGAVHSLSAVDASRPWSGVTTCSREPESDLYRVRGAATHQGSSVVHDTVGVHLPPFLVPAAPLPRPHERQPRPGLRLSPDGEDKPKLNGHS